MSGISPDRTGQRKEAKRLPAGSLSPLGNEQRVHTLTCSPSIVMPVKSNKYIYNIKEKISGFATMPVEYEIKCGKNACIMWNQSLELEDGDVWKVEVDGILTISSASSLPFGPWSETSEGIPKAKQDANQNEPLSHIQSLSNQIHSNTFEYNSSRPSQTCAWTNRRHPLPKTWASSLLWVGHASFIPCRFS